MDSDSMPKSASTTLLQDNCRKEILGDEQNEKPLVIVQPTKTGRKKPINNDYMYFDYNALQHITSNPVSEKYTWLGQRLGLTFKLMRSESKLVKTLHHSHGFTECSSKNQHVSVIWAGAPVKSVKMRDLQPWQRLNQFPRSTEITKKDRLFENIERAKSIFGDAFNFIPESYVTPRENERLRNALNDLQNRIKTGEEEVKYPGEYIVKPTNSRQGKGIFFINQMSEMPEDYTGSLLVSKYLSNPLLVNGFKFDLRIYVAVTSFYPLVAYVYSEGLTRLASMQYDSSASSSSSNEFIHLTNYSINKNSDSFVRYRGHATRLKERFRNESMTSEDLGHKWTLGALLRHLQKLGKDSNLLMLRIEDLIVKSLLSIQGTVTSMSRSVLKYVGTNFELFGFDVLVDDEMKPWLLEVNLTPSLACDAPLDSLIKTRMMADLMNLSCVPLIEKKTIVSFTSLKPTINQSEQPEEDADEIEVPVMTMNKRPVGIKRSVLNRKLASGIQFPAKQKMETIIRKFRAESERNGEFIRVFPRSGTWNVYSGIMEDLGQDDFDQRLYAEVIGPERAVREASIEKRMKRSVSRDSTGEEDEEEICKWEEFADLFHDVMINAPEYQTMEDLPPVLQQFLTPWYKEAEKYIEKITQEGETYACKLPTVRPSARLRTKSCAELYEVKRAQMQKKKEEEQRLSQEKDKENNTPK